MKKLFRMLAFVMVLVAGAFTLQSCLDDDDDDNRYVIDPVLRANAVVTLKTDPVTHQFYMQLNDSVTVIPTNMTESPYGNKELRALAILENVDSAKGHYSSSAFVTSLDTIRTKAMSPMVDSIAKVYSNDPVEIVRDWTTVCEDGYLTLRFRTYFGGVKKHILRLVRTGDDEVTLYHDANNDVRGQVGDGLIAFRLNDLPSTGGKYKEYTLKWLSFSGEKSVTFMYKSRE